MDASIFTLRASLRHQKEAGSAVLAATASLWFQFTNGKLMVPISAQQRSKYGA
jgi:hypothetical protein